MLPKLPVDWSEALTGHMDTPGFRQLTQFIIDEYSQHEVFPPDDQIFAAFQRTPIHAIKVVLLGQDPYPTPGHAHGLCFSVRPGIKIPASLRNIYKELEADLGIAPAKHGHLASWADQGILMVNTVLTVRSGEPNSHAKKGWEAFTDQVLRTVNELTHPVIFVLWGGHAQKKRALIDESRHRVIATAHPSPLSAHNGFLGSKPFSQINTMLTEMGQSPIEWRLPDLAHEGG